MLNFPFVFQMFEGFEKNVIRYKNIGVEVQVTEIDVSCGHYDAEGRWNSCSQAHDAFVVKQAEVYRRVLEVCLRHENCRAFLAWGVFDGQTWLKDDLPLLFDKKYKPKKALWVLRDTLTGKI